MARHHGRQITRSLDPTGGRPPANRSKTGRSILKSEGDSDYERRVKQKKTWEGNNQEWLGLTGLSKIKLLKTVRVIVSRFLRITD